MEKFFCYVLGVLGSFISCVHGKCDIPLRTLILFMVIDYISGILIAVFFKKSPKSERGTLKSEVDDSEHHHTAPEIIEHKKTS